MVPKTTAEVVSKLLEAYPIMRHDLSNCISEADDLALQLTQYIEDHKWLINKDIPFAISIEQALFSWHENVYTLQWNAMKRTGIIFSLPQMPVREIFDLVSKDYYYLSTEYPNYATYEHSCYRIVVKHSKKMFARLLASLHI